MMSAADIEEVGWPDPAAALAAIPEMLPPEREVRVAALSLIRQVLEASGGLSTEDTKRLNEGAGLFGGDRQSEQAGTKRPRQARAAS